MTRNEMSSYFEDPEFKESLAKYEGMVNSHTPCYFDADELVDIAEYYAFKGKHTQADEVINYALGLHPDHTDLLIFRSRSLALKGKLKEAYQVADLIDDPTDREVIFLYADLLMEEERLPEAEKMLSELAQKESYSPEVITDILLDYLDIQNKEYANRWFDELTHRYNLDELFEKNKHILHVVAAYYSQFNDYEKAIPLLQKILDDQPYSIEYWTELGRCHLQLNHYAEANEALDFALAIDENDAEALYLKALYATYTGQREKSCDYFQRLLAYPEKQAIARLSLSRFYQNEKNYEASLEQLRHLVEKEDELTPLERSELYQHYAQCCAAQGNKDEGEVYLRKAFENTPYPDELEIEHGRFYMTLLQQSSTDDEKEYYRQEADKHFQKALQISILPKDRLVTLFNIASLYFDSTEFASASTYFEHITSEYPSETKTTYFFLLHCYLQLQDAQKFFHYLAKMRKEWPELYEVLGTTPDTSMDDLRFMGLIQMLKENINNGNIDLDKYL